MESCLFKIRDDKVKLEINDVPEYCLFPGQVIVVEGKNPDGKRIVAEKIYTDAKPEMYPDFEPSKNLKGLVFTRVWSKKENLFQLKLFFCSL